MRKAFVLLAIAAQVTYLAVLAADREILVRTGTSIYLRTAPIDPRDPFRGDYVTLRYGINAVHPESLAGDLAEHRDQQGRRVYAHLRPMPGSADLLELDHVSEQPRADGPYLAGEIASVWRFRPPDGGLSVSYGIEKLFVEQGHGLEIEDKRGRRDGLQIPMEVELAVGEDGRAAIRDYRWSPMGIQFEVLRSELLPWRDLRSRIQRTGAEQGGDTAESAALRSPEVRMTLHNVSDRVLWLVDPGDHCSFHLISLDRGRRALPLASPVCDELEPSAEDFHRLGPGESYAATLDLDSPRWLLDIDGKSRSAVEINTEFQNQLRIVYRPEKTWAEGPETTEPVRDGELWSVELQSPSFSAVGRVD